MKSAIVIFCVCLGLCLPLALEAQSVNPAMPVIPTAVFNVTGFGAVGDGATDNTIPIQNTINACNAAGGGTVEIPAGTFLSGPITLTNSMNLQVDAGGLLQMLPLYTYPGGTTNAQTFINCNTVHDLAISGRGTIDGQGAPWWVYNATNNTIIRPMMLDLYNLNRFYVHDITIQNSPNHHFGIRDFSGNITVSNLTINTIDPSPNTDGIDYTATNGIIENSFISDGDDNLAIGSTGPVVGLLITNCFFGTGHGVSVLGPTALMSGMTVVNCTFKGTDNGIRWKCSTGSSAPVSNINYYNITMTNVGLPIVIYSYYNETGTPDKVPFSTVLAASNTFPITATTPVWSNITFSNMLIVTTNDIGGVIWGPTEMPVSNITFVNVTNNAPKTFDLYNVTGLKILNSQFNFKSGNTFTLCNAGVTISNTTAAGGITVTGAVSANSLAFYQSPAALKSTNLFAAIPLTLGGNVLTNTGNLTLGSSNVLNFVLGTSPATLAVVGNLTLGGTVNFIPGSGFTNGTYTIMSYSGTLSGTTPIQGSVVPGYSCSVNTSTAGQVNVVATYTGIYPFTTTNTLVSSANPSTLGNAVTFTATVTPAPTNGEIVTFYDSSTVIGTGALNAGRATFSTSQLSAGTHYLTAVYGGDVLYLHSTSAIVAQLVEPPPGTIFSDNFGTSTVDSNTPGEPNVFGTSYQILSAKTWLPIPAINSGSLVFGMGGTSSGVIELQALFTTNPIALLAPGDFVQLQVTFTDTAGLLTQSGNWDFGLYNSGGGSLPVPGGLQGNFSTGASTVATGYVQDWAGYVAQIGYSGSGATSGFYDRQPQYTGTANNNQDLISIATGTSYASPAANPIGTISLAPSTALTVGNQYTECLTYTLTSSNALQLSSQLYTGTGTTGAAMSAMSAVTGTTPLTYNFDGLAFGWRAQGSTPSEMTVNAITVTGQSSGPIISFTVSSSQVMLTWPGNYLGWLLQSNATGLASGNWVIVPNSGNATNYPITLNPASPNVFYRLVQ